MKTTITLAGNYNVHPFELFAQDVDEMIMLINYLIALGDNTPAKTETKAKRNDGFWDM